MNKRLLTLAVLAAALCAAAPYNQPARSQNAWMTVSSIKTGREYYLEVTQDGKALLREESLQKLVTRRGRIPAQLARDFFREIDNSEVMNSQNIKKSRMVFYKGEILRISTYINGEQNRTESPLNNLGEAFSHALGEIKKAALKMPQETAMRAFISAEPVEGDALDAFHETTARNGEVKTIETYDIQKIKPLMAAIRQPYRLIPLETDAEEKELQVFISTKQLYGLSHQFYLPSTRGTFKCQVLEVTKRQPAGAGDTPAAVKRKRGKR